MKKYGLRIGMGLMLLILTVFAVNIQPLKKAYAEVATAVSFGETDYEELTLQVYNNNNTIIYYSLDENTWVEVEGNYSSITKSYYMDISWVSTTSDVTIYFKGNIKTTIKAITLPMQDKTFKVTYSKADEDFTFYEAEDFDEFEWRKSSDYNWNSVSLNENSSSYKQFLNEIELLRAKGSKVIIRLPQIKGSGVDAGSRASKEITITVSARAEGPSVKVNASKLTLNTTDAMEYYDSTLGDWVECSKNMTVEEIAPKTLFENGAKTVTLMIRKAATSSVSYSKTVSIIIKGQSKAPVLGGNTDDVSYYYNNSKLVLGFNNASTTNAFEYTIIKPDVEFDTATANWTSVTSTKLLTISSSLAPKGSQVYVRRKGIDANTSKGIELELSSAVASFTVNY